MPGRVHLVVDLSAHGLGHLAQLGPVLQELSARVCGLRLTLRTDLAPERLRARIRLPFEHVARSLDVGAVMHDAVTADRPATRRALLDFHEDWEGRVRMEAEALAALRPDALLANVPYSSLAAARRVGVPGVALCSLNWADIMASLFPGDEPVAAAIDIMRCAYAGAEVFIRPRPAMPMAWLHNTVEIDPIALKGRRRREELRRLLGIDPDTRLALVALGGIPHATLSGHGAGAAHWHFLEQNAHGEGVTDLARLALPFHDVLASVDALITKPGYGLFVEAAALGLPLLYLPRPDWAETACLVDWLHRSSVAECIDPAELADGQLVGRLDALLARAPAMPIETGGARQAADLIRGFLDRPGGRLSWKPHLT